jgi:CheY-like chemotaxis protein
LRPGRFALRPLLESSLEVFRAQAAERGISFRLVMGEGIPPEMQTDPGRLRQVLLNLLSNAVKFSAPGVVQLTASATAAGLRLSVRDGGPVIGPADRARLFRPFTRLERPEGAESLGTGLGLAICRNLVSLMGGRIGCDTCEGGDGRSGNEFWLVLPVPDLQGVAPVSHELAVGEAAGAPAEAMTMLRPTRRLPRTRILLVEDVPANQMVTATLLRREGHMVDIAASGSAAIRAASHIPYDVVLMDIFMPGMSGQEATQHIRALPGPAQNLPIIALTANVQPDVEATFRAAGMDGILGKPVSLPDILAALDRTVWHLAPEPAAQRPTREPRSASGDTMLLSDDRVSELRANLSPDTLNSLVDECLIDLNHRLPALRRAVATGARAAIAAQAHAMVGTAAGYGMAALEARLRALMAAARDGHIDPESASAVEVELARSAAALREAMQHEMA